MKLLFAAREAEMVAVVIRAVCGVLEVRMKKHMIKKGHGSQDMTGKSDEKVAQAEKSGLSSVPEYWRAGT